MLNLTLEERGAIATVFDHGELLSGLRKVWADQADYWLDLMKQEALKPEPNASLIVQYAAKADVYENAEANLREVVRL